MAKTEMKETKEKKPAMAAEAVVAAPVAVPETASVTAAVAEEVKKEKKDAKQVIGIAHIYSTYNNTIIHITDLANHTVAQVSGGKVTKHSRLKATPTVAMFAAKRAAEMAKEAGITDLYVRISSEADAGTPGPGSHSAVKSLGKEGLRIINILDNVPIARGGPKKKGGKRGRRV